MTEEARERINSFLDVEHSYETARRATFFGQPIHEFTKEELIKIIDFLGKQVYDGYFIKMSDEDE